jgi:hypothetical protein
VSIPALEGADSLICYTPGRELQTGKALPGLKRRGGTRTSSVSRIFVEPHRDDSDHEEILDRTKLCRDEQRTLPLGGSLWRQRLWARFVEVRTGESPVPPGLSTNEEVWFLESLGTADTKRVCATSGGALRGFSAKKQVPAAGGLAL